MIGVLIYAALGCLVLLYTIGVADGFGENLTFRTRDFWIAVILWPLPVVLNLGAAVFACVRGEVRFR